MTLDLNSVWFVLVGVLFAGYAILDGFDLGVGALHLFARTDLERRTMLNSIGPVWDGNEVWLVTGGGALFAAFPEVYATVFSGFYLALILLLLALIFRAVAIEFRSKRPGATWRSSWDVSFSVASLVSALLIGVALGNIAYGIPLDANHEFAGTFFSLLNPYALLIGITTVALFVMHGAIYVLLKTEGDLHNRARLWARNGSILFIITYVLTTVVTLLFVPHMTAPLMDYPILFLVPVLNVLAVVNIPMQIRRGRDMNAFLSSCVAILALLTLFGIGMYPNMVFSSGQPDTSLTIYNAASSARTLKIMLIVAAMGMPLVLAYTTTIYWIFRGKVKLESHSY